MQRFPIALLLVCASFPAFLVNAQERRGPDRDDWVYDRDGGNWNPSWNRRPFPSVGACFFTDNNFRGNRFCVRRGDRLTRLPGSFGDNISSIQVFGNARVVVFNDRDYRGGSDEFRGSIRDLRRRPFRDGHTWNNRISSLIVR
jgi:hypothetical protein